MAACVLALAACAANDANRTTGEGIAAGAVVGAVAGNVVGGNRQATVVGGVLGAVVGGVVGASVANKKADYAQREDMLRASADRAMAVAQASRQDNDQRSVEIAALDQSVQRLRNETMSAGARQALAQDSRQRQKRLLAGVDTQLQRMRAEIARQNAVIVAEQKARANAAATTTAAAPTTSGGLRQVSAGIRDLQQQERTLEEARLQLMQIDKRRAY